MITIVKRFGYLSKSLQRIIQAGDITEGVRAESYGITKLTLEPHFVFSCFKVQLHRKATVLTEGDGVGISIADSPMLAGSRSTFSS